VVQTCSYAPVSTDAPHKKRYTVRKDKNRNKIRIAKKKRNSRLASIAIIAVIVIICASIYIFDNKNKTDDYQHVHGPDCRH
jgi:uncharacterized membrane protein